MITREDFHHAIKALCWAIQLPVLTWILYELPEAHSVGSWFWPNGALLLCAMLSATRMWHHTDQIGTEKSVRK